MGGIHYSRFSGGGNYTFFGWWELSVLSSQMKRPISRDNPAPRGFHFFTNKFLKNEIVNAKKE